MRLPQNTSKEPLRQFRQDARRGQVAPRYGATDLFDHPFALDSSWRGDYDSRSLSPESDSGRTSDAATCADHERDFAFKSTWRGSPSPELARRLGRDHIRHAKSTT